MGREHNAARGVQSTKRKTEEKEVTEAQATAKQTGRACVPARSLHIHSAVWLPSIAIFQRTSQRQPREVPRPPRSTPRGRASCRSRSRPGFSHPTHEGTSKSCPKGPTNPQNPLGANWGAASHSRSQTVCTFSITKQMPRGKARQRNAQHPSEGPPNERSGSNKSPRNGLV